MNSKMLTAAVAASVAAAPALAAQNSAPVLSLSPQLRVGINFEGSALRGQTGTLLGALASMLLVIGLVIAGDRGADLPESP